MDAVPVISRGHNVAVLIPPIPEALTPLLSAIPSAPILLIAADRDQALACARGSGLPKASVATAAGRTVDAEGLMAMGAADALDLMRRSALRPAAFNSIVIAWPEEFDSEAGAALESVLGEAGKDAQRIIVSSDPGEATASVIERFAFKAMTFGFPPADPQSAPPAPGTVGAAQYVLAPASRLADWMLMAREALGAEGAARPLNTCPWTREAAAALAEAGQPVLILAPNQLKWARRLFSPLTALPMPGLVADLARRTARVRAELTALAETADLDRELLMIAPLLDRFDPTVIAAAALHMAGSGTRPAARTAPGAAPAQPAAGAAPSFSRIWVGIGRKDNAKPGDLVGVLVNEVKVPADAVGRIEMRELFCLVEVRPDLAETVVKGLTGANLRGRRLTARVDRGPSPGGPRPPRRV